MDDSARINRLVKNRHQTGWFLYQHEVCSLPTDLIQITDPGLFCVGSHHSEGELHAISRTYHRFPSDSGRDVIATHIITYVSFLRGV